jgi:hypothetical protein
MTEAPSLGPELLKGCQVAPFGLVRKRGQAWSYLVAGEGEDAGLLVEGPLELRGFTGLLGAPERSYRLEREVLEAGLASLPPFALTIASWLVRPGFRRDESIAELRPRDLVGEAWEGLVRDEGKSLYWSDRFEPEFYRAQARAGCIAVAMDRGDRVFLMPELQEAYAVLDWGEVHRSRSLERLFRSERLAALDLRLVLNPDPEPLIAALLERWRADTWLHPAYLDLLRALAAEPREDFRLWAVELRPGGDGPLVAGELGYSIGRTYTSLTGYHGRDSREWRDLGKVQLHLLAARLCERGYAFWNLGHPYMQYKLDLGARILPRRAFLERWKPAVEEADPGLG